MTELHNTWPLRGVRRLARALTPASFWRMVDDDLKEELKSRRSEGAPAVALVAWAAAQYLRIAIQLAFEEVSWRWRRPEALRGGWALDFKQAWRSIRRRPTHSALVILTIAIAVGATTSVYSVVDSVLIKPLPYPESHRLVRVWQTRAEGLGGPGAPAADRLPTNAPIYFDWKRSKVGFESLGAYGDLGFVWSSGDGTRVIKGQMADSGTFEALSVEPQLGRWITAADEVPERPEVVILSDRLWRSSFSARPDVLGSEIVLNRRVHRVIGVMPPDFRPPVDPTSSGRLAGAEPLLWTPLTAEAKRGHRSVAVLARLGSRDDLAVVQSRFQAVHNRLVLGHDEWQRGNDVRLEPLLESYVGDVRSTLLFLLGAVGLVLLVAIVNITNMLAAQSLHRRRDLAVHSALGAGAGRLVRGRLVESGLLAGLGGVLGTVIAWWLLPIAAQRLPPDLPRLDSISMNLRVLLGAASLTGLTAMLVGLFPAAMAARTDPHKAMSLSARGSSAGALGGRASKVRSCLVVAEVAAACILLIGAALLLTSFERLWAVDRGFETQGLVAFYLVPDYRTMPDRPSEDRFHAGLKAALEEIPGVKASAMNNLPLSGQGSGSKIFLGDHSTESTAGISVGREHAMAVVGVPLVKGRLFHSGDSATSPPVAIINRTLADTHWPDGDAIGQRLSVFGSEDIRREIVGITEDVRQYDLAEGPQPEVYLPAAQSNRVTHEWVLRIDGDIASSVDRARQVISSVSPTTAVARVLVLDEAITQSVAVPRFRSWLLAAMATLAGLLALLGVYGVVAFSVAQRRKEIGVRKALGARSGQVVTGLVGSGLRLVAAGLGVGLASAGWTAWTLSDVLAPLLFRVSPGEPWIYTAVAASVVLVGAFAAYVPARRASAVSPVEVLDR